MSGGTPPTSPRFGAPRYNDLTDAASFSTEVNAITDAFDAGVAKRLSPNILAASATVADHQVVIAGPDEIVTLPTPSSEHELICVYANESVTGAHPVAVAYGGTGGGKIYGKGLTAGVSSFPLGTQGSFAWLFSYDGTNWRIVHGEQDTGWIALSLTSGVGSAGYGPEVRLQGDTVRLKGALKNNSGGTLTTTLATIPAGLRPTVILYTVGTDDRPVVDAVKIATDGTIFCPNGLANGNSVYLDAMPPFALA